MNKKRFLILLIGLLFSPSCSRKIKGNGKSESIGSVSNGSLKNGRKFPFRGKNYCFFSPFSYSLLNRAWVHEKVLSSVIDAYKTCETTCPKRKFLMMECSRKHGGTMWPHKTHQNGTSIDFATPLLRKGKPFNFHHRYGLLHYAMKFDEDGNSARNKNVKIDFETMGKHLLALDQSARKHGMYIKKVIFKIDLKDDFFRSKAGKKIKRKGIYFAKSLPKVIDEQHDDHYHVDFGLL